MNVTETNSNPQDEQTETVVTAVNLPAPAECAEHVVVDSAELEKHIEMITEDFCKFRNLGLCKRSHCVSRGEIADKTLPEEEYLAAKEKIVCPLNFKLMSAADFQTAFGKSWDFLWGARAYVAGPKGPSGSGHPGGHHGGMHHHKGPHNNYGMPPGMQGHNEGELWDNPSANLNKEGLTEIFNLGDIRDPAAEQKVRHMNQFRGGHHNMHHNQPIDVSQVEAELINNPQSMAPAYPSNHHNPHPGYQNKPRVTDESKKLMNVLGIDSFGDNSSSKPADVDPHKIMNQRQRGQAQLNSFQEKFAFGSTQQVPNSQAVLMQQQQQQQAQLQQHQAQQQQQANNHQQLPQHIQQQQQQQMQQQYLMAMQQNPHHQMQGRMTPEQMAQQQYMMQNNPQYAMQLREQQVRMMQQMQYAQQQQQQYPQHRMPNGGTAEYTQEQMAQLQQQQQQHMIAQQRQMMMWQHHHAQAAQQQQQINKQHPQQQQQHQQTHQPHQLQSVPGQTFTPSQPAGVQNPQNSE